MNGAASETTSAADIASAARPATMREMEALVYIAASAKPVAAADIGLDLAYDGEFTCTTYSYQRQGHRILRRLDAAGMLVRQRSTYTLTERGRIAAALIMAKQPGMREAFFDD